LRNKRKTIILLACLVSAITAFAASGKPASASVFAADPNPDLAGATSSYAVGDAATAYFYEDTGLLYVAGTGAIDVKGKTLIYNHPLHPIGNGIQRVYFTDGMPMSLRGHSSLSCMFLSLNKAM
jgi:hypothetical protein